MLYFLSSNRQGESHPTGNHTARNHATSSHSNSDRDNYTCIRSESKAFTRKKFPCVSLPRSFKRCYGGCRRGSSSFFDAHFVKYLFRGANTRGFFSTSLITVRRERKACYNNRPPKLASKD